jgi:hypothetical protein
VDLVISPDLNAFCCYSVVTLLGAWVGVRQISSRLAGVWGIWFVARTWLLFLAYVLVPVILFWLLDRTGATTDTSLFAAVLIGGGYERIITGQSGTIRIPGDLSQFWTPFLAYGDTVEKAVRERLARDRVRLDNRIISMIASSAASYDRFEQVIRACTEDVTALDTQLSAIDHGTAGLNENLARERKTRALYAVITTLSDGYRLMHQQGVINRRQYYYDYVFGGTANLRSIAGIGLSLVICASVFLSLVPEPGHAPEMYYIWRVGKPSASANDTARARRHLIALMNGADSRDRINARLIELVRRPGVPMERIDLALRIMLESQSAVPTDNRLAKSLVRALRTSNADVRIHVHDTLTFLAESCGGSHNDALWNWKPAETDATALMEENIRRWDEYWRRLEC